MMPSIIRYISVHQNFAHDPLRNGWKSVSSTSGLMEFYLYCLHGFSIKFSTGLPSLLYLRACTYMRMTIFKLIGIFITFCGYPLDIHLSVVKVFFWGLNGIPRWVLLCSSVYSRIIDLKLIAIENDTERLHEYDDDTVIHLTVVTQCEAFRWQKSLLFSSTCTHDHFLFLGQQVLWMSSIGMVWILWGSGYLNEFEGPWGCRKVSFTSLVSPQTSCKHTS